MSRAFLSNGAGPAGASLETGGRTVAKNHAKLLIAIKSHVMAPSAPAGAPAPQSPVGKGDYPIQSVGDVATKQTKKI